MELWAREGPGLNSHAPSIPRNTTMRARAALLGCEEQFIFSSEAALEQPVHQQSDALQKNRGSATNCHGKILIATSRFSLLTRKTTFNANRSAKVVSRPSRRTDTAMQSSVRDTDADAQSDVARLKSAGFARF